MGGGGGMAGYAEAEEIIPVVGGGQGKARDGPAAVAGDAPSAEARAKYRAKILLEETRADRAVRRTPALLVRG